MRTSLPVLVRTALLGCILCAAASGAAIDRQRLSRDLQALTAMPNRSPGSPGYEQAVDYVRRELQAIPGVEVREQRFRLMVPVTRSARLVLPDGAEAAVFPFWPAQTRLNATPAEGVRGRLVYCGNANYAEIKPGAVRGQIAVIEASARQDWSRPFAFGARALIVLGDDATTFADLRAHDLRLPVHAPRFYVDDPALVDRLRRGAIAGEATLRAEADWREVEAVNLIALLRPSAAAPSGWKQSQPPAAVMFSAPLDSASLVPDRAPGAGQALQVAGALAMLRELATRPPPRPVAFFFGGAETIQMTGTRQMLLALAESPAVWRRELERLDREQRTLEQQLERARAAAGDASTLSPRGDRALIERLIKIVETDAALEQDLLFRLRMLPAEDLPADAAEQEARFEQTQIRLSRLRFLLQQHPERLRQDPEMLAKASGYLERLIVRLGGGEEREGLLQSLAARRSTLQARIALYQWLAGAVGRDPDPPLRSTERRPIEMLVGLDFSDRGVRAGPMFWGAYQQVSSITDIQDYTGWMTRLERAYRAADGAAPDLAWYGAARKHLDFEPITQSRSPRSYLATELPLRSELASAWAVPGLSMVTLDDLRARRDTPADTFERMDLTTVFPQIEAVLALFERALADAEFRGPVELKRRYGSVEGQVVSAAMGRPVPDLPREGFLATYYYSTGSGRVPRNRWMPALMGVRLNEVRDCDAEGRYVFEGLPRLNNNYQQFAVKCYRFEAGSGRLTASTDLGRQSGDISLYADIRQSATPLRSLVFTCDEFRLFGLFDPRYLQQLGDIVPLDARRNAEPQRYDVMAQDGMVAGSLEPGSRTSLLFRYGQVGNRLVLLNMPPPGEGRQGVESARQARGYRVEQLNSLGPLALATARDFWALDDRRLQLYRSAGVSNQLLDDLHRQAGELIAQAEQALSADDGEAFVRLVTLAWANEARVYEAAGAMASDVVRGAIFLLLLCVPFAFCMERLLVGTPSIYGQIAWGSGFFAVMALALWQFHPAFKISASPLIIVLAFAIIFMSIVVIYVVYGKFDSELKRLRSGRGSAEGASLARASVLMSAVLLGIANMRRRRFRTALTSVTIVLITFAVLCFTSSQRYLDTTTLPTGVSSSHAGVMLRQRGFRPVPEETLQNLRAALPEAALVQRWWNVSASDPRDQLHVANLATADGRPVVAAVQAALGLSPGESRLSRIAEALGEAPFARLEGGESRIVFLPRPLAEQLGVAEGALVRVGGIDLEVAGVFEPSAFDQKVFTLSEEPLGPLNYTSGALDAGGRRLDDNALESLDLSPEAAAAELSAIYEPLPSSQFIILPAEVSRRLPNSSLRTVAIGLSDEAQVRATVEELTRRFAMAMFAGFDDGVRMVAASQLSSVSGAGQVAIPLAIAGMIIFNTMMGSIAERRREIHVYTSLGLAPLHVGALFIAEAMTYGLIGTVFGYVIGQGVGTVLMNLGWLGGVTLNYSGTSAIMTMGLILLIVLLSALAPARLAGKIAAPSIERTWRVPLPEHDRIIAVLPFTINRTAAEGALAYLAEFFDAHREGSIGKFSAGAVQPFVFADEKGRSSRGIQTVIWLTPFDLGVRQHLMLLIHPGQFPEIYEVQVVLQRLSGDDGSWHRMNRTFLTELRKQFLQWRSLAPQRMKQYVEQSRDLFEQPSGRLVTTLPGEAVRLG